MKNSWPGIFGINLGFLAVHNAVAMANAESGYLTYEEPAVNSAATSLSTVSYVFSLLLTFAIVIGLAYFTSKFLSRRLAPSLQSGNMLIHDIVALGANKALYLVEIGSRLFLLGVTDHNITHLQEFTDEEFIAELRAKNGNSSGQASPPAFQNLFQQQIEILQRMAGRISGGGKPD